MRALSEIGAIAQAQTSRAQLSHLDSGARGRIFPVTTKSAWSGRVRTQWPPFAEYDGCPVPQSLK